MNSYPRKRKKPTQPFHFSAVNAVSVSPDEIRQHSLLSSAKRHRIVRKDSQSSRGVAVMHSQHGCIALDVPVVLHLAV